MACWLCDSEFRARVRFTRFLTRATVPGHARHADHVVSQSRVHNAVGPARARSAQVRESSQTSARRARCLLKTVPYGMQSDGHFGLFGLC